MLATGWLVAAWLYLMDQHWHAAMRGTLLQSPIVYFDYCGWFKPLVEDPQ